MRTETQNREILSLAKPAIIEPRPEVKQEVTDGAKLLCVANRNIRRNYMPGPPVLGRVYCVREVFSQGGVPGVLLVGIIGPTNSAGLECGFLLSRFRWIHG